MEYERALYRVYERCLEGLRDDNGDAADLGSKTCKFCEYLTLGGSFFFLICLIILHVTYVGNPGCLPTLLRQRGLHENSSNIIYFKEDQILQIDIDELDAFGYDDSGSNGLFGEISSNNTRKSSNIFLRRSLQSNQTDNSTSSSSSVIKNSTIDHDYEFSLLFPVLFLNDNIRKEHKFSMINTTLSRNTCFGPKKISQLILPLGGIDIAVMNNIIYTFKKPGILRTYDGDEYSWSETDITPYNDVSSWIYFKFMILVTSVLAFFLLSTISALLVRVLISSGVVLLFPIFWCFEFFGMRSVNSRIITLSYPWLGIPIEILLSSNQSPAPFVIAHCVRIIIYYFMYEASLLVISVWLYSQRLPGQRELWLFGIMMIWEYFSMVYVRCATSIKMFPRASLALFLLYHFYLYNFPFGFHILALLVLLLSMTWLMIITVSYWERKAFNRGYVNIDQPRALYNYLPWPHWNVALAPDFTVFQPVSRRHVNVYDEMVADRPTAGSTAPNVAPPALPVALAGGGPGSTSTTTSSTNVSNPLRSAVRERRLAALGRGGASGSIGSGYQPVHENARGNTIDTSSNLSDSSTRSHDTTDSDGREATTRNSGASASLGDVELGSMISNNRNR